MRITEVSITIKSSNGETHTLIESMPAPFGDNPAFMGQQLETALSNLGTRGHGLVGAMYGKQIY